MQQPDILFIVLDTQRADRLGCYGRQVRDTGESISPNLDAFARSGVIFDQAVSPAQWTIPSHASMFTGLYPSAHQLVQSNQVLGPGSPHRAEILKAAGYQTIGFCNNPLVGILNNGLKRGFDTFYNYGGAIPSMPDSTTRLPWPINWTLEKYTQFLRRISYPIQNFFGRSDLAFRVSLNAWLTPLWSKLANFKGQNQRSVRDLSHMLRQRERKEQERPLFLFLNLMETHLPFWPPGEYIDRVAPYFRGDHEAREILRRWNREAYRWAAPLEQPLDELEERVLSDLYDAEVAYQDDYLGELFDVLAERKNAANTLTAIVSDHGDGLGEHGYFGHAFVAYEELVHVPLILHWPGQIRPGKRMSGAVSTRRLFHTMLGAALPETGTSGALATQELRDLSLMKSIAGNDPENNTAFAEIFPPLNYAKAIRKRQPELLDRFRCLETRQAVVRENSKLIRISDWPEELYHLANDPLELANLAADLPGEVAELNHEIEGLLSVTEGQKRDLPAGSTLAPEADRQLVERLRGLGYVE